MKLSSQHSLANEAAKAEQLPSRLKIFNWGVNKTLKGDVIVNEHTAKVLSKNQQAMGRDTIALDYEHNTVPETTAYKESADPRPVAGHFSVEVVPGEGVYLTGGQWTPSGKENARNFKDLSPAPYTDDKGVLLGLHSCALTQTGAVFDLNFLDCKDACLMADFKTLSASTPDAYKLASIQDPPKANKTFMNHMAIFRKALAMGEDSSDEDVLKCMSEAISTGKFVRKGPLDDAGGTGMQTKAGTYNAEEIKALVDAQLTPLVAKVTQLTEAATNATKQSEDTERSNLINQASRDGKIIPLSAESLKAVPVTVLREMIAALPKTSVLDRSKPAIFDPKSKGKIQRGGALTLSINGQQVPITLNAETGGAAEPSGLERTRRALQEQYDNYGN